MDKEYISNYLTHWTGNSEKSGDDKKGFDNLCSILKQNRLKLTYNPLLIVDIYNKIHDKMVCFTDIPLSLINIHCKKYGRFGIVFDKDKLARQGAHPVFYFTHASKEDIITIFKYISGKNEINGLPNDVFQALKRHFYFTQEYSETAFGSGENYYYEREWRIGEDHLIDKDLFDKPNTKPDRIFNQGKSAYYGKLLKDGEDLYFEFNEEDVCFVIVPKDYYEKTLPLIENRNFKLEIYEKLIRAV